MPEYDVFISYSHLDKDWVDDHLVPDLQNDFRVAIDSGNFQVGTPSEQNMMWFVEHSRRVVFVLTPDWVQSKWTQFEGVLTSKADPEAQKRKAIPIILRKCEQLPDYLAQLTWIDFSEQSAYEKQLRKLFKALAQEQSVSASVIPVEPAADALAAVASLSENPNVNATVLQSRGLFRSVSDQITEIADYKALHDQLHDLQKAVDAITANPQKEMLEYSQIALENIIERLNGARTNLPAPDTAWVDSVAKSIEDFKKSVAQDDAALLASALKGLNGIIGIYQNIMNTCLTAAAKKVRLEDLITALQSIAQSASEHADDPTRLAQLRAGAERLKQLNTSLRALVSNHGLWQDLDVKIRAIENNQDVEMRAGLWDFCKPQTDAFSRADLYRFADTFSGLCRAFATALAGRDDTAMRPAIRKLRGYVGDRFFYADADLNRQCEQLRRLGDALSGLLGDAAPVFTHEGVN